MTLPIYSCGVVIANLPFSATLIIFLEKIWYHSYPVQKYFVDDEDGALRCTNVRQKIYIELRGET